MVAKLSIEQIREKLEYLFTFTNNIALNRGLGRVVQVEAARAAAQIAEVLLEIHEIDMFGMLPDPDNLDVDRPDLGKSFESEPE